MCVCVCGGGSVSSQAGFDFSFSRSCSFSSLLPPSSLQTPEPPETRTRKPQGIATTPRSNLFLTAMTTPCIHTAANPKRNVTDPNACYELTTNELAETARLLGVASFDLVLLHGPSEPFGSVCPVRAPPTRAQQLDIRCVGTGPVSANMTRTDLACFCVVIPRGSTPNGRAATCCRYEGGCGPDICAVNQAQWRAYQDFKSAGKARVNP